MISVGENSGRLLVALEKAAQLSEEEAKTRKRISTALVYPSFLLTTFLLILAGLVFYLLPQMEGVFASTSLKPPWMVQAIFSVMKLFSNPLMIAVVVEVSAILVLVVYGWVKKADGRVQIDAALLKVPVLGSFILSTSLARCAYNLGLLLDSGITIVKALEILPKTLGNESLARSLVTARKNLIAGDSLADSLEQDPRFPRIFIQMLRIGEESGELSACIHNLCRFYDQEVEVALASFLKIFEPLIIIFMGILVGSVFLTFLPMINQLYKGLS